MGDRPRPDLGVENDQLVSPQTALCRLLMTCCLILVVTACADSDGEPTTGTATSEFSPFQRGLLDDGELTYGEMEFAAESYASCVAQQGVRVEVEYDEQSKSFGYRVFSQTGNVTAVMESEDTRLCEQEFIGEVELFWADQAGPSEAEDQAFYGEVAACMRDRGFDVVDSKPSTLAYWIDTEPREYDSCFEEVLENQG